MWRRVYFVIAMLVLATFQFRATTACAQTYRWLSTAGGNGDDTVSATAVDSNGNVYVTGLIHGRAVFGSNAIVVTNQDVFIAKYGNDGSLVWVTRAAMNVHDVQGIAVGPSNEIYITGGFDTTSTFGNTNITAVGTVPNSTNPRNLYLANYDSTGAFIWVQQTTGPSGAEGNRVIVDATGNSYVAGQTFTFASSNHTYVAKRNTNGTIVWTISYTGGGIGGLYADGSGNVILATVYDGDVVFPGGTTISTGQANAYAVYVAKLYKPPGLVPTLVWVKSSQISDPTLGFGNMTVDSSGSVFVSGSFRYTFGFDSATVTTGPNTDYFIAKFQSDGTLSWISQGGLNLTTGSDVGVDSTGNVFVSGTSFNAPLIAKHDASGNRLWHFSSSSGAGVNVKVDRMDRVLFAGSFTGNTSFDAFGVTNQGGYDIFLSQVDDKVPPVVSFAPTTKFVRTGASVTYTASARSAIPVSYQWLHDDTPISGATQTALTLSNIRTNDAGHYGVEVSNLYGPTRSANSTLYVEPKLITGQWDFDNGDLSATVGAPLQFIADSGDYSIFTNVIIGTQIAHVLSFPAYTSSQGLLMNHGARANGGGNKVNQWTLIMDVLWLNPSNQLYSGVAQIDSLANTNDADLLIKWTNSIGIPGAFSTFATYPTNLFIHTNEWHRLVYSTDLSTGSLPPISRYIDGQKLSNVTTTNTLDGADALLPSVILFSDYTNHTSPGMVNSIQIRNYKMTDVEVAQLGGPSALGIPLLKLLPPEVQSDQITVRLTRLDEDYLNAVPSGFEFYEGLDVTLPLSGWTRATDQLQPTNGAMIYVGAPTMSQHYYQILR